MPPEVVVQRSAALDLHIVATLEDGRFTEVRLVRHAQPTPTHPLVAALLDHVERGVGDVRDLPVALRVPPFHARVLERLREIPRGKVVTYGALAAELHSPGASRAVGGACAANPLPLVVPCHRVVNGDGAIGNYSGEGGSATKRRLLELEGALPKQARLL